MRGGAEEMVGARSLAAKTGMAPNELGARLVVAVSCVRSLGSCCAPVRAAARSPCFASGAGARIIAAACVPISRSRRRELRVGAELDAKAEEVGVFLRHALLEPAGDEGARFGRAQQMGVADARRLLGIERLFEGRKQVTHRDAAERRARIDAMELDAGSEQKLFDEKIAAEFV